MKPLFASKHNPIGKLYRLLLWPITRPLLTWRDLNLYWKISIWFWVAMCLMLLVGGIIFTLTINPGKFVEERSALISELNSYGVTLDRVGMFKHSPEEALDILSESVPFSRKVRLVVLDKNHKMVGITKNSTPIIEADEDKSFQEVFDSMLEKDHRTDVRLFNDIVITGPVMVKFSGQQYSLFLLKRRRSLLWIRLWGATRSNPLYLLMAVIASGIFCFGLTHHLKRSLKQLQQTVQKIAEGNLSARVCKTLVYQGDEIGRLSEAIDTMADRIEKLVHQKQRLLRDVSHELRSPLTRLKISNALTYKKAGHIAAPECERIDREIDRLDNLIGHIINWSKISSGLFSDEKKNLVLNDLLKEVTNNSDFEAKNMGKQVHFQEEKTLSTTASAAGITSAFENIIRNALRFTPEKSTVEVTLQSDQQNAIITIRDFGPGVPETTLPMLFEPFYRVDETRGGDNSGSGLGMAITKAVIENHKGTIRAENASPGLRVLITLPLT